jgi:alpha-L-fucosidase
MLIELFPMSVRGVFITLIFVLVSACADPVSEQALLRSREIPQWFEDAKLGIFIHWGPASVPAYAYGPPLQPGELEQVMFGDSPRKDLPYAEWYLNAMNYPDSETARHHAQTYGDAPYTDFKPVYEQRVDEKWDPEAWAELFQNAGARYVVLVTKHHDGYTLWPSEITNPHRENWGSPRDMVGELAAAVRARGMRFGTYYSTGLDWSFLMYNDGDRIQDIMRSAPASQDYADYVYAQMAELIDLYHPDVLWADIGYPSKGRQSELFEYYFSKVPDGTVNDRWGAVDVLGQIASIPGATWVMKTLGKMMLANQSSVMEDDPDRPGFKTAEYDSFSDIPPFKWEATRGLGGSFAYNTNETAADMLTGAELIDYVVDTVSKNGNVLINVGPDSYGQIPTIQQTPLLKLGAWLSTNGEAIYGTSPWIRYKNQRGRELRYTQTDDALYAIVIGEAAEGSITIESPGISWEELDVLGAQVVGVEEHEGQITLNIDRSLPGPAVVVRYSL